MRPIKRRFLLLILLLCGECTARAFQDPYDIDFFFDWSFWDKRLKLNLFGWQLANDANLPLTMGGFRGTWQIAHKEEGTLRIITTGAGHLFADNIPYGDAWPEKLSANLQKKGRSADIWNMAVNGSTVIFVERCLLETIIEAKPDVVILSHSGYNEALYSDISESSLVYPTSNWRNAFLSSALFRTSLKYGSRLWTEARGKTRTHKVPIDDFVASYERVITALQKEGISVILLQQEVITPDLSPIWFRNDLEIYRTAFAALAQKHMLLYVDPRQLIQGEPNMYFDEQEYYSVHMHLRLAKILSSFVL